MTLVPPGAVVQGGACADEDEGVQDRFVANDVGTLATALYATTTTGGAGQVHGDGSAPAPGLEPGNITPVESGSYHLTQKPSGASGRPSERRLTAKTGLPGERCSPGSPGAYPLSAASLVTRSCRRDLDAVDLGVVLDGDELDGDRAGAARRRGERLGDRLELPAGGGEDVEVGQHLRPVDEDVEDARPGGGPVLLGEVEADVVAGPGGEAGDGVGEVAVAVVLVDRLGGGGG